MVVSTPDSELRRFSIHKGRRDFLSSELVNHQLKLILPFTKDLLLWLQRLQIDHLHKDLGAEGEALSLFTSPLSAAIRDNLIISLQDTLSFY